MTADLDEGDVVVFLDDYRAGDDTYPAGTKGTIVALSGRRGQTYYRVEVDGTVLARDVNPSAVTSLDEYRRAAPHPEGLLPALPTAPDALQPLRDALIEGNLTHDCPACTNGQLRSGALCPLCDGWTTL